MAATTHYKSKTTMGAMGGTNLKRAVGSHPPQYMRNTCLIGTGTDHFLEAAYLLGVASTDWSWANRALARPPWCLAHRAQARAP